MTASVPASYVGSRWLDIPRANIWIDPPASTAIPARGVLTKSHKGQILRVFLVGTETIQCEIYRVHIRRG